MMASVCIVSVLAIDVSAMALLDGGFRNPVCHEVFEQQARQEPFPAADAFQIAHPEEIVCDPKTHVGPISAVLA
jgi:hypothetical protein